MLTERPTIFTEDKEKITSPQRLLWVMCLISQFIPSLITQLIWFKAGEVLARLGGADPHELFYAVVETNIAGLYY